MTKVIYKYPLVFMDTNIAEVMLPVDHHILHVGLQYGRPCMWVEFLKENENNLLPVMFHIYGTGHSIERYDLQHIKTFMDGPLVWHIFKEPK